MYRLSVYYVSSTLCDMVAHILYPTSFMAIVYFMAGFKRTVAAFLMTHFTILLIVITSQVSAQAKLICFFYFPTITSSTNNDKGAGELFGAMVLSIKRAGMIASLVLMLFLLTGGYYVQVLLSLFITSSSYLYSATM